jgi:hypothetical protein
MLYVNGCYFGWKLTSTAANIGWVAGELPNLLCRFPFALITSNDSNRNDWLHSAYLAYLATTSNSLARYQFTADGVLVSGSTVCEMLKSRDFFSGFDEIWLSNERITETLPKDALLTSEAPITADNTLKRRTAIAEWIARSKCLLGIADGHGVNYATTDEQIAQLLEAT